ncbi:MAG: DsbA family oxidoreductase [Cognatishimia sp.]|uniref:DsbA family oxidoreductase n=1 Tax=Cognatishimia sp. TaxID=2211648 RepID=UPI003B8E414E
MALRVDIVSDVVCPWCAVGFKQLEQAVAASGHEIEVYWHPFELNPQMVPEGQNLREHLAEKYGSTKEQSDEVRGKLKELGNDLGFAFNFKDDSRIFNTFNAHQLIHWAGEQGKAHDLKLALLTAYFSDGKDVSDTEVLLGEVARIGLDADQAREAIESGEFTDMVRSKQEFWHSRGINSVPSMIFDSKHLVPGAQGTETYISILQQLAGQSADKG